MKALTMLAVKAVLLGTMAAPLLVTPAFGQQEVDPTLYPLPEAAKTAAQPTKQAKAVRKHIATSAVHKRHSAKKSMHVQIAKREGVLGTK
jgi:hypothetical protein